jgi:hypothetical protein
LGRVIYIIVSKGNKQTQNILPCADVSCCLYTPHYFPYLHKPEEFQPEGNEKEIGVKIF